ncbi:MAG: hypothetical protein IT368_16445 [Candidatus Hydrogenedentes bacterium]|nr:hypothetical protein [Candidatus Hydrogenedentota bacterium]
MSQYMPPNPPPAAPPYPPPPPRRSGAAGCLVGCLILTVVLIVLVVVGVVAAYFYGTEFLVQTFTDAEPMPLPQTELSEAEQTELDARLEAFNQSLQGQGEAAQLVLTGPEVNALVQQLSAETPFANSVHVTIEGDTLQGQISLPIEQVVDIEAVRGRYLNGRATFDFSVVNGTPVLFVRSLEVKGQVVPEAAMQEMGHENILKDLRPDAEQQEVLDRIREIRVRDGKMIVELKPSAQPAAEPAPAGDAPEEAAPLLEAPAEAAPIGATAPVAPEPAVVE